MQGQESIKTLQSKKAVSESVSESYPRTDSN